MQMEFQKKKEKIHIIDKFYTIALVTRKLKIHKNEI